MRRVVIAGGPGAGKTTLLAELAHRGFATVSDSARAVIAERLARGQTPRPEPEAFAREILRRDIENYAREPEDYEIVFYERSAVEALGMLSKVARLPEQDLRAYLSAYRFSSLVFVLPPWAAIYRTDAERDHTFEHAERVYAQLLRWYRFCGYVVNQVPCLPVEQRANYVLQSLSASSDA